jgi:hypothetical protein
MTSCACLTNVKMIPFNNQRPRPSKENERKVSPMFCPVWGRAIAQAVSRQLLTAEARVCSQDSPCGNCGGQSGTGIGFFPSALVFPYQYHSTDAPNSLMYHLGDGHGPVSGRSSTEKQSHPIVTIKKNSQCDSRMHLL